MNLKIKYLFVWFLWFLLIFGPVPDSSFGNFGDVSFLVALALFGRGLFGKIPVKLFVLGVLLLSISFVALVTTVVFDLSAVQAAQQAVLRPIKALIVLFGMYSAVDLTNQVISKRFTPVEKFAFLVKIIYLAVVVHGLIMILQFLNPDFRNYIYSFTEAKHQLEHYQLYRMAGLSGGGGAQVSVIQSLGFVIGLYLIFNVKNIYPVIAGNFILIVSILLTGRSGLLAVVMSLVVFLPIYLRRRGKIWLTRNKRRNNLFVASIYLLATTGVTYLLLTDVLKNENFELVINTTSRLLLPASDVEGDLTLQSISQMFIFPDSVSHLLFGRADYILLNTFYQIDSDIGYIKIIWAYGIIGMGLHLLFYGYALFLLYQITQRRGSMRAPAYLAIALIGLILFFNVKELFFFARMSYQISVAIFVAVLFHDKSIRKSSYVPS